VTNTTPRRVHNGTAKYFLSMLVMATALLVAVVAASSGPTPADADAANDRSAFGKAVAPQTHGVGDRRRRALRFIVPILPTPH
jgi:hypothetical protein